MHVEANEVVANIPNLVGEREGGEKASMGRIDIFLRERQVGF